ncbi:hypothetical protein BAUCODRAFT_365231 [Baudoinia panamericana UAMH 10762]|uniref:Uncharacterized protein n=1 Tax=Baudoinia panamericana (strain UAMH 10762) TaxID=717646 RepID=M2LZI3_BAUPA|nr:uncharacterized protein BAUCODRAFT_365231 [Baudoinia panamericana UAMH 10762]EMD00098.1 hypothetical protein BAUCODRAFT_365231 [Baudoinia panamericana UAMH 10762]
MADFLENLWSSVFTPGATPTLLIATNATFAALQFLLLALLVVTYSIHFLILSVLCGGLWVGINWFATELQAAQAKEEEAERLRKLHAPAKEPKGRSTEWKRKELVADSEADDEEEDTETETEERGLTDSSVGLADTDAEMSVREQMRTAVAEKEGGDGTSPAKASGAKPGDDRSRLRPRRVGDGDRSGEVSSSTDSEWEKVESER